ncbi:unnamed protein product [Musa acuminata var. zebrina]
MGNPHHRRSCGRELCSLHNMKADLMDPFIGEIDLCLQLILEILWFVRFRCSTRQFV